MPEKWPERREMAETAGSGPDPGGGRSWEAGAQAGRDRRRRGASGIGRASVGDLGRRAKKGTGG